MVLRGRPPVPTLGALRRGSPWLWLHPRQPAATCTPRDHRYGRLVPELHFWDHTTMKRAVPYLVVVAAIGFYSCLSYFEYLARISPTRPDSTAGLITRMNDHGYYFYVHPWQGVILNFGPFAFVALFFLIVGITQQRGWSVTRADFPRWLNWLCFAAFAVGVAYIFWQFP